MRTALLSCLSLCGCLVDVSDEVEFGRRYQRGVVEPDEIPDPRSDESDEHESDSEEDSGDDPFLFDLGVPPPPPADCKKIDFLFVIDNSISMKDEQENLIRSVPGFIRGIEQLVGDVESYHVGVATTDAYAWNSPQCQELGSLVESTGGPSSSESVCGPYAEGRNYMTEADDLERTFACAAQVGVGGSPHEQPMEVVHRITNGHADARGECNYGFLREDALLVLVIVTDEADGPGDPGTFPSPGSPQSWYDDLVAAKQGNPNNVVAISFINTQAGDCEFLPSGGQDGVNIATFTDMFAPQSFIGDICAPDYGPVFAEAVAGIASACDPSPSAG